MPKTRLSYLRKEKNWTLENVAAQLNITKAALGNIESGRRKPSYQVIVGLQHLFGKPIDELLEFVNSENTQS